MILILLWSQQTPQINASVNYRKNVSVHQKLVLTQRHQIQANCKCHILNKCVKYGLKAVSFDAEGFVIKVYNSFSSSAKQAAELYYQQLTDCFFAGLLWSHTSHRMAKTRLHCWFGMAFPATVKVCCHSALCISFTTLRLHFMKLLKCSSLMRQQQPSCTQWRILEISNKQRQKAQNDKFYGSSASQLLRSATVSTADWRKFELEAHNFMKRCIDDL